MAVSPGRRGCPCGRHGAMPLLHPGQAAPGGGRSPAMRLGAGLGSSADRQEPPHLWEPPVRPRVGSVCLVVVALQADNRAGRALGLWGSEEALQGCWTRGRGWGGY